MKKIAIFTGYYTPHTGGVERYCHNLAKELTLLGNQVFIITTKYDESLLEREETQCGTIYRLPVLKFLANRHPFLKYNQDYRRLIKQIRKEEFDTILVNTRFWISSFIGAKIAKKENTPISLLEHGTSHFTVNNKILDFLGACYEHFLTFVLKCQIKDFYGVSKGCNQWLTHFHIKAKGVFYNSIDEEEYEKYKNKKYSLPIQEGAIKILFLGRVIPTKGVKELVQAYEELKKQYPIQLIIAGDGSMISQLKQTNPDIIYTGNLNHDDVMSLYNTCDVFVNPSFSEGMPTTVLEAGLMKCAIVATRVGGTVEIITDEKEGLLCEPTKEDIQEKLERMIIDENLRKNVKEAIHQKIKEKFSWKETARTVQNAILEKKEGDQ